MGSTLSAKNWSEFQHYKHRNPPWIKLHKKVLDDRLFQCLPVASRALAPMLWLLASESQDGLLPYSLPDLSFRLHQSEKEIESALKPLIDKGFFIVTHDASGMLADCKQLASESCSEKSREETETEVPASAVFILPEFIDKTAWEGYCEMRKKKPRAKMTEYARDLIVAELTRFNACGIDTTEVLNKSTKNNWTDVYAPKENGNGNGSTGKTVITVPTSMSPAERTRRSIAEFDARQKGLPL